jgi:hypothetical protein
MINKVMLEKAMLSQRTSKVRRKLHLRKVDSQRIMILRTKRYLIKVVMYLVSRKMMLMKIKIKILKFHHLEKEGMKKLAQLEFNKLVLPDQLMKEGIKILPI